MQIDNPDILLEDSGIARSGDIRDICEIRGQILQPRISRMTRIMAVWENLLHNAKAN